jgi:hypothetical protein
MGRSERVGREMDRFQINVEVFERAVVPYRDGETVEELLQAARSLVPYPDNEMWAVVVHGWATARANASVTPETEPGSAYRRDLRAAP